MLHPDTRSMLDQIDTFLCRHDDASQQLMNILTALRSNDAVEVGPTGNSIKFTTTCVIRRAAFPKLAALFDRNRGMLYGSHMGHHCITHIDVEKVRLGRKYSSHWYEHIVAATLSLGLFPPDLVAKDWSLF